MTAREATEMDWWLRALAIYSQDWDLVSSTHIRELTTICNPNSGCLALSSGLCRYSLTHVQTHAEIYRNMNKNKMKLIKCLLENILPIVFYSDDYVFLAISLC